MHSVYLWMCVTSWFHTCTAGLDSWVTIASHSAGTTNNQCSLISSPFFPGNLLPTFGFMPDQKQPIQFLTLKLFNSFSPPHTFHSLWEGNDPFLNSFVTNPLHHTINEFKTAPKGLLATQREKIYLKAGFTVTRAGRQLCCHAANHSSYISSIWGLEREGLH